MIRPKDYYRAVSLTGSMGSFEVDFTTFIYDGPVTVFLSPGQYVDVTDGDLHAEEHVVSHLDTDARCLFVHLYAAGRIRSQTVGSHSPGAPYPVEDAIRQWHALRPLSPRQRRSQVERLLELAEYVDARLEERPRSTEFADLLGLSHQSLNRLTQGYIGKPVGDFVVARQVTRARSLLAFEDLSVAQVGSAVGFGDADYFIKRFGQVTGETPGAFRKRIEQQAGDPFLARLVREIHLSVRLRDPIGAVSAAFGMHRRSLDARVYRHAGRRLSELVAEKRTAEIIRLLVDGASVQGAAAELGFSDAFAMSRFFKRHVGLAPSHIRQSVQSVG